MQLIPLLLVSCALFLNVKSNPCEWLNDGLDCVIQCAEGFNGSSSNTISGYIQSVYYDVEEV